MARRYAFFKLGRIGRGDRPRQIRDRIALRRRRLHPLERTIQLRRSRASTLKRPLANVRFRRDAAVIGHAAPAEPVARGGEGQGGRSTHRPMAHFGSARSSRQVRPKAQHGRGREIQRHLAELYGTEVLDLTLISRTTAPMPRRLSLPSQLSGGRTAQLRGWRISLLLAGRKPHTAPSIPCSTM